MRTRLGLTAMVVAIIAALGLSTIALGAKRTKTKTFSTGSVSFALPTVNSPYDLPTINVPVRKAKIKDVNVSLVAGHTQAGQLDFKLLPPNGPDVNLASGVLNITDNWGSGPGCSSPVTFDDQSSGGKIEDVGVNEEIEGSYRPTSPLSALKRKSPQGNWRLAVNDDVGGDAGTITCFEVEIKYKKAKKKRK
jgi:subtilisin-like proprotein convertase family protein